MRIKGGAGPWRAWFGRRGECMFGEVGGASELGSLAFLCVVCWHWVPGFFCVFGSDSEGAGAFRVGFGGWAFRVGFGGWAFGVDFGVFGHFGRFGGGCIFLPGGSVVVAEWACLRRGGLCGSFSLDVAVKSGGLLSRRGRGLLRNGRSHSVGTAGVLDERKAVRRRRCVESP